LQRRNHAQALRTKAGARALRRGEWFERMGEDYMGEQVGLLRLEAGRPVDVRGAAGKIAFH